MCMVCGRLQYGKCGIALDTQDTCPVLRHIHQQADAAQRSFVFLLIASLSEQLDQVRGTHACARHISSHDSYTLQRLTQHEGGKAPAS